MNFKEVAKLAGCDTGDVLGWKAAGWLTGFTPGAMGRAVEYTYRNVTQAKALFAAKQLKMPLHLVAYHLDQATDEPQPGMILVIRWSGEFEKHPRTNLIGQPTSRLSQKPQVQAVVMQWSEFDPSDGRSFLIIGL
jgi:hypothetical protein